MHGVATYSMVARSTSSSWHTTQCYVSTYGRYLVVRLDVAMTMHCITHGEVVRDTSLLADVRK